MLLLVVISMQSIFVSNWLQNLKQSKFVPSNLLIINFYLLSSLEFLLVAYHYFFLLIAYHYFFLLIAYHYFFQSFAQMFVKIQSSRFPAAFLYHVLLEGSLSHFGLPLPFFLHFLFLSVLLLCFEALLLAHHFLVLQFHVAFTIF